MSGFSVPLSSLAVQTMTTMVLSPASAPADAVVAVPPQVPDLSITADVPPTYLSGFRAEGAPELDAVFGDSESFRRHIDRFFVLADTMEELRRSFAKSVQTQLTILDDKRRGPCPTERVARHYYESRRDGDTYRALGAELDSEHVLISRLDRMGETEALTPDYRWKVRQSRQRYQQALTDLKEMRVAFVDQLGSELRHRRCSVARLIELGKEQLAQRIDTSDTGPQDSALPPEPGDPVIPASTVTFYVDNQACEAPLRVFLDGTLLGEVPAKARAAFQALAGRHSLCLIPSTDNSECGEAGTVRTAFLHDGWSIGLHCQ